METIESFQIDYLEECANLLISTFNSEPWNEKWTFKTASKRLEETYKTHNFKGWVYKKDDKIIGVIMGNCEQWYEGFQYYIKDFFVDSTIQNRGIGSKILKYSEEELKAVDVNSIHFWTLKGGRIERFYKKNGYEVPSMLTLMIKDLDDKA
ncbi:GNAT family N-acetyltransferase [Clostridium ganghwense]|uniref:GNAT family N-acetyltransferase n=1 Tax=Clostridium ganghwense TaxID=312089 RepID=A0ABT4CSV7_9CLOT|nr:GNAT family N-acetyltransferase [Clostridium ganghwense]MCY6372129.1 GNAT family N-acetyltransferase [Clostridium ganghwense]